jgi:broad-specificity NMP kinase
VSPPIGGLKSAKKFGIIVEREKELKMQENLTAEELDTIYEALREKRKSLSNNDSTYEKIDAAISKVLSLSVAAHLNS